MEKHVLVNRKSIQHQHGETTHHLSFRHLAFEHLGTWLLLRTASIIIFDIMCTMFDLSQFIHLIHMSSIRIWMFIQLNFSGKRKVGFRAWTNEIYNSNECLLSFNLCLSLHLIFVNIFSFSLLFSRFGSFLICIFFHLYVLSTQSVSLLEFCYFLKFFFFAIDFSLKILFQCLPFPLSLPYVRCPDAQRTNHLEILPNSM